MSFSLLERKPFKKRKKGKGLKNNKQSPLTLAWEKNLPFPLFIKKF